MTISPTEAKIGELVTISSRITNTGDATGTKTIILKINDSIADTKDVTIAAGSSQVVTFTALKTVAGTYTVEVEGLSGTFTVKAIMNWWLIGIVVAVVFVIIGVVFVVRKRGVSEG